MGGGGRGEGAREVEGAARGGAGEGGGEGKCRRGGRVSRHSVLCLPVCTIVLRVLYVPAMLPACTCMCCVLE